MGVLAIQGIAVVAGAARRSTGGAPAGTTRFVVSTPVAAYMQVSTNDQSPFLGECAVTINAQPTPGQIWQAGTTPGGAPPSAFYTWVTGTPVGNQIKIGVDAVASKSALMVLMAGLGWNVNSTTTYSFTMSPPDIGQSADDGWGYVGQSYLMITSGLVQVSKSAGFFIPAGGQSPILPAAPSQNVWLMGAPGVSSSLPENDAGASVLWMDG